MEPDRGLAGPRHLRQVGWLRLAEIGSVRPSARHRRLRRAGRGCRRVSALMSELPRNLSVMPITDRTRKILWATAGSRCSICRVLLVTEGTDTDDPSVFGEEAHIVGQSPNGPRAGNIPNVDSYANLILLCRKDHKRVDDQVGKYTVERLKEIKRQHEEWITSQGEISDPGPVRLIPDPAKPPKKMLTLVPNGTALWRFVRGACSSSSSWPEGLSDAHEDLIAAFLDNLRDWMDISGDLDSHRDELIARRALDESIEELTDAGFVVGARERFLLLTGGVNKAPSPWRAFDIEVQPFSAMQLVDAEGRPFDLNEIISKDTEVDA
jgi:hypothetical protein